MATVLLAAPSAADPAQAPRVVSAYTQVTADGRYVGPGLEGVEHALVAYAAIHEVTGDPHHREVFDALLERMLASRPAYMGFGVQVLEDPFLLSYPRLVNNVHGHANGLVSRYATRPDELLYQGDIRTLTNNANFLVAYAKFLQGEFTDARGEDRAAVGSQLREVDDVATALLDRLVPGDAVDRAVLRRPRPRQRVRALPQAGLRLGAR